MRFTAVWPVEDYSMTVRELANEAMADLMAMAREHGAVIFGPPTFHVSEHSGGLTLHASAPARPAGRSMIRDVSDGPRPVDEPDLPRTVGTPKRAVCGTDGGYHRHLRRTKTPPCDACRAAHAEANRRQAEARRTG